MWLWNLNYCLAESDCHLGEYEDGEGGDEELVQPGHQVPLGDGQGGEVGGEDGGGDQGDQDAEGAEEHHHHLLHHQHTKTPHHHLGEGFYIGAQQIFIQIFIRNLFSEIKHMSKHSNKFLENIKFT